MPNRVKTAPGAWQKRLVGIAEIAEMFGVSKSTVTLWADADIQRLPEPWDTLKLGRVWRYEDIEPLIGQLPTPRGLNNSKAMRSYWAHKRRVEARAASRQDPQNGNPSTGTSSSSETR